MRRHVEIHESGQHPDGSAWSSTEWVPVPSVFDRVPAWAEMLGYGVVIGLPAAVAALLFDPFLGVVVGLAGSAVAAAVVPRFYQSRTERQSGRELDELELQQDFQGRQIDRMNREAERARRRR
jgi:hypothetical protein